ncbi:MAG TPA: Na/Pi symporter, partial [Longimicrobium sp.]
LAAATFAYPLSAQSAEGGGLDVFSIVLGVVAGLALFLFGVTLLADALKRVAGDRMKKFLERCTTNRFAAVGTGTVATTLLDSSSVTIIMVIALVDAGVLAFARSLGVILGANIGTTVSSQIIALDVDRYAPIALVIGLVLAALGGGRRQKQIGRVLLGIGLVFYGLGEMDQAVAPLKGEQSFIDWMVRLENPLLGAAIGALVTIIVQSSSATLGIVITLAGQGLLTLPAGIALMLGAEIGTCADTLLACIGRSRAALRAGVFHLLFNVTTVAIGLMLTREIATLAQRITPGAGVERFVANAHVLFNVAGVLLVLPFLPLIARALQQLIPAARREARLVPLTGE